MEALTLNAEEVLSRVHGQTGLVAGRGQCCDVTSWRGVGGGIRQGRGSGSKQNTHSSEYKAYVGGGLEGGVTGAVQSHSLPLLLPATLLLLVEHLLELQEELVLLLLEALQLLAHLHHLHSRGRLEDSSQCPVVMAAVHVVHAMFVFCGRGCATK